jgi:polyphosphate glucokinase
MARSKKKARGAKDPRDKPRTKPAKRRRAAKAESRAAPSLEAEPPFTRTIDIGGTAIKTLLLDRHGRPASEHRRQRTPSPAHPAKVLATIEAMLLEEPMGDRVSVGFPGVVSRGVVKTAPNLGTAAWQGFDLQRAIGAITARPTRVINDADLLGFGAIAGKGVELVLTLGTGLGSGLFVDGKLVPNLELGHHPFKKGETYEERVSDAALKRIGRARFRRRIDEMIAQLAPILNYEHLYLGGGNARLLHADALPDDVSVFDPTAGMGGGVRLWSDAP